MYHSNCVSLTLCVTHCTYRFQGCVLCTYVYFLYVHVRTCTSYFRTLSALISTAPVACTTSASLRLEGSQAKASWLKAPASYSACDCMKQTSGSSSDTGLPTPRNKHPDPGNSGGRFFLGPLFSGVGYVFRIPYAYLPPEISTPFCTNGYPQKPDVRGI